MKQKEGKLLKNLGWGCLILILTGYTAFFFFPPRFITVPWGLISFIFLHLVPCGLVLRVLESQLETE